MTMYDRIWGDHMGGLEQKLYYDNYSPIGDIAVIAMCFVILILIYTSYVSKTRAFFLFNVIIGLIFLAAGSNILYHYELSGITSDEGHFIVYLMNFLYHAALYGILYVFVLYIIDVQRLEMSKRRPILIIATVLFFVSVLFDLRGIVKKTGFHINADGTATDGKNIFPLAYVGFVAIIMYLMIVYRNRIFKQVMRGFYGTMLVAFIIISIQYLNNQSSFTVTTFLFPTIAMLYIIHSNPYNIELGAINITAMEDMIRYSYERKRTLIIMSLYIKEFDEEGKNFPKEIQAVIRRFAGEFFRGAFLFQVNNGHMILLADKHLNPDSESRIISMFSEFNEEYLKHKLDYKIVYGLTMEEVSRNNEYISFIRHIHKHMGYNEKHQITQEDVDLFNKYEYILKELADIYRGGNLRDPRVLAYCQPVFNVKTGRYDTAEALMRLKLQDTGLVFPDQFIPLAEENGFIHTLTKIILQKTCDEIRYLIKEGYEVNRISVNVSVLELRDDNFCKDISEIIEGSDIPNEKVAIEITESQSDKDFDVMKNRISVLKEKGIKFYLDDFGTGYSNMERIMELPFDIIKFDRSLVMASDADAKSETMVGGLANMFSDMNYSVLYEGVENEVDEKRCINMSASYLQGFKYSKPIPIMDLKNFFSKIEESA